MHLMPQRWSTGKSLRSAFLITLAILGASSSRPIQTSVPQGTCTIGSYSGDEAPDSLITLQMPFVAGETWTVGGSGSFYGSNLHCNSNNDYYATDWNLGAGDADLGKPVLSVASGTVADIDDTPCPTTEGFGCFVRIDHTNNYRTEYDHLDDVTVVDGATVNTWTLIGKVGKSGMQQYSHLHLRFQRNNGGYSSYCYNNGNPCPNGETAQSPQGHRPSPMRTGAGSTKLVDAQQNTSVNGRVYLPTLRNKDGWVTHLYVRNDGTEIRSAKISYFKNDGTPTPAVSDTCVLNPNQWCWIPVDQYNRVEAGTEASAYVDGGEAVSVAIRHNKTGGMDLDNLVTPESSGLGDPTVERVGRTLYAASIYNNISSVSSSTLKVLNTGPGSASVTVTFKGRPGYSDATWSLGTIAVNGRAELNTSTVFGTTAWLGSAIMTSTQQPIAAQVHHTYTSGSTRTYNASSAGDDLLFVPAAYKNNSGFTSELVIQNIGYADTTAQLKFYDRPGNLTLTHSVGVNAQRAAAVELSSLSGLGSSWAGSVRIVSTSNPPQLLVTTVEASHTNGGKYGYTAASRPATTVYMPRAARKESGQSTSYLIQNTSTTQTLTVTATYYNSNGTVYCGPLTILTLLPYQSNGRWGPADTCMVDGWQGSIVFAGNPASLMVAMMREDPSNSTSAYNGITR